MVFQHVTESFTLKQAQPRPSPLPRCFTARFPDPSPSCSKKDNRSFLVIKDSWTESTAQLSAESHPRVPWSACCSQKWPHGFSAAVEPTVLPDAGIRSIPKKLSHFRKGVKSHRCGGTAGGTSRSKNQRTRPPDVLERVRSRAPLGGRCARLRASRRSPLPVGLLRLSRERAHLRTVDSREKYKYLFRSFFSFSFFILFSSFFFSSSRFMLPRRVGCSWSDMLVNPLRSQIE